MRTKIAMAGKKNIALVAHDKRKEEFCEWAGLNRHVLAEHSLYATAITGHLLTCRLGLNVTCLGRMYHIQLPAGALRLFRHANKSG